MVASQQSVQVPFPFPAEPKYPVISNSSLLAFSLKLLKPVAHAYAQLIWQQLLVIFSVLHSICSSPSAKYAVHFASQLITFPKSSQLVVSCAKIFPLTPPHIQSILR